MQAESIHPDTMLGAVALTISDIHRSVQFYQDVIGLEIHRREGRTAYLGAGSKDLLLLVEDASAEQPLSRGLRFTGLYHLAILVPSRLELARTLSRLLESGWPLQGFADHGVSEAIYLADPDGNGIEIYRDSPRSQWPTRDGQLQMVTDPLDVRGILAELETDPAPAAAGLPPDTLIGHIHLRVADIQASEDFYCNLLGFDLVQRFGPSACFVSAGGYHHHIGFNTWESAGAPPPPPGAAGLRYFTICLPDSAELARLTDRIRQAGLPLDETQGGFLFHDPAQNAILLKSVLDMP
jgi:catechol 2,3-dioxygenase